MKIKTDRQQMEHLGMSQMIYEMAERIVEENHVRNIETRRVKQFDTVQARVGTGKETYSTSLSFNNDGYIQSHKCNCSSGVIWKGACVHVAALFIHISRKSVDDLKEKESVNAGKSLCNIFEQETIREVDSEIKADMLPDSEKVRLEPTFCVDSNGKPYLTFTVGKKRMYILKNVSEFAKNVEDKEEHSYGKDLTFNHDIANFHKESIQLVGLVKAYQHVYDNIQEHYTYGYYYNRGNNSKNLHLYGKGMDEFFEIYREKDLPYLDVDKKSTITFTEELPKIRFTIEGDSKRIILKCNPIGLRRISGDVYSYLVVGNCCSKVPKKYVDVVWPIISSMSRIRDYCLIFKDKEASRFLTYVLPHLKQFGMIKDLYKFTDKLEIYDIAKKVYIDADKGRITCKVVFGYGGKEITYGQNKGTEGVYRDASAEYKLAHYVKSMGFEQAKDGVTFEISDDDIAYDFCTDGIEKLKNEAEVYISDEFKLKTFKPMNKTRFGVRIKGNLLEMSIETSEFTVSELLDIMGSYNKKKKYHKLGDGRFVDLADDGIISAAQMLSGLNVSEKDIKDGEISLPKYRALYLDAVSKESEALNILRDREFKKIARDFKNYKDLEFDLPHNLEDIMRGYQKDGFNWLKTLSQYGFGGILADDMGLGKTLQVISVLLSEKGNGMPSLVVSPTSLIYNWQSEINKFAPELTTEVVNGIPSRRKELINEIGSGTNVYITTYDMLKRDIESYENKKFRYVIADEAQNIKNPSTQNAKAVKLINSEIRYALTGTPIENSLSELWSIFDFVMPAYLFNMTKFAKHYETPIVKDDDKDKAAELRKQISPFILRRIKKDVLKELPDKVETLLAADMSEEQRKIYAAYMLTAKGELDSYIEDGYEKNQIKIIALLTRLRQICCHPSLFIENYSGGSGKLEMTMETLRSAKESGHRVLLFSQFTSMLAILKDRLTQEGISYFYLDGATPSWERLEMSERFNNGENQVFLISLKAGGTGLNLTGADVVIHYDPWWNPAVMAQAADRAHRFGQRNMVQVFNMVAKDSIEEKIMLLQQKKKDLVDTVIQEGASFISKMSPDEIRQLFDR